MRRASSRPSFRERIPARSFLLLAFVISALATDMSVASAGGGVRLDVVAVQGVGTSRDTFIGPWASPGSTVTVRGEISTATEAAPLGKGWWAYLRTPDGKGAPSRLVPASFEPVPGEPDHWTVSVTFVVPDVPTADYWVDICSEPTCTQMIGDLDGGYFSVIGSRLVHTLLRSTIRLEARARGLRTSVVRVEELEDDITTARTERDAMAAEIAATRAEVERWRSWVWVLVVVMASLFVGAVLVPWMRVQRDRRRDTVDVTRASDRQDLAWTMRDGASSAGSRTTGGKRS